MDIDKTIKAFERAANQQPGAGYVHVKKSKKGGITYEYSETQNNSSKKEVGKKLYTKDLIEHAKALIKEVQDDPDKEKRLHEVIAKIAERGEAKLTSNKTLTWRGNVFKKIWNSTRAVGGFRQKYLESERINATLSIEKFDLAHLIKDLHDVTNFGEIIRILDEQNGLKYQSNEELKTAFENKIKTIIEELKTDSEDDQTAIQIATVGLSHICDQYSEILPSNMKDLALKSLNLKEDLLFTKRAINSSKNLNEVLTILDHQRERILTFKNDESFVAALEAKIKTLTLKLEVESYDDLKNIRNAKNVLILINKRHGKIINSDSLNLAFKISLESLNSKIETLAQITDIKKQLAQEKIAALVKGKKTRDTKVTTRQMLTLIEPYLLGVPPDQLEGVARALCREINEMMENPEIYKGKSLQLSESQNKKYLFYSGDKLKPDILKLGLSCWLEMSKDGKDINLLIIPPDQKILGQGTYKKVSKAQSFKIPFKVKKVDDLQNSFTYRREGEYSPKALLETLDSNEAAVIDTGIDHQKKLQDSGIVGTVSLPEKPSPLVEGTKAASEKVQYIQEWYNSDLCAAAPAKQIPLDFSDRPNFLSIDTSHILGALIDVGKAFINWHASGIIHCDVKPANILLKVSSDKTTVSGLPADYDFAQEVGIGLFEAQYQYWDVMANQGLGTTFTDVYGLAITLGQVIVPEFSYIKPGSLIDPLIRKNFIDAKILAFQNENIKTPAEIALIKGALELIGEIVSINERLGESITLENDTMLSFLKHFEAYRSAFAAKINGGNYDPLFNNLVSEMNENFAKPGTYFADHVLGFVPQNTTAHQRVLWIKNKINACMNEENISPEDKRNLEEILKKIEHRKGAILYMLKISPNSAQEHPIYRALQAPKMVDSIETAKRMVNEEISIYLSSRQIECPELVNILNLEAIDNKNELLDVKQKLEEAIRMLKASKNNSGPLILRLNITLNHIHCIENSMGYVMERRNYYKQKAADVMSEAMPMNEFVARLNTLQQNLQA